MVGKSRAKDRRTGSLTQRREARKRVVLGKRGYRPCGFQASEYATYRPLGPASEKRTGQFAMIEFTLG